MISTTLHTPYFTRTRRAEPNPNHLRWRSFASAEALKTAAKKGIPAGTGVQAVPEVLLVDMGTRIRVYVTNHENATGRAIAAEFELARAAEEKLRGDAVLMKMQEAIEEDDQIIAGASSSSSSASAIRMDDDARRVIESRLAAATTAVGTLTARVATAQAAVEEARDLCVRTKVTILEAQRRLDTMEACRVTHGADYNMRARMPFGGVPQPPNMEIVMPVRRCTADRPEGDGQACADLNVRIGEYCAEHLDFIDGLAIAPSRVPGAGLGLFATRVFYTGQYISWYTGQLRDELEIEPTARYAMTCGEIDEEQFVIDAARTDTSPARMMNDAFGSEYEPNAALELENHDAVYIYALTNILPGDEILTEYGAEYWLRMGKTVAEINEDKKRKRVPQPADEAAAAHAAMTQLITTARLTHADLGTESQKARREYWRNRNSQSQAAADAESEEDTETMKRMVEQAVDLSLKVRVDEDASSEASPESEDIPLDVVYTRDQFGSDAAYATAILRQTEEAIGTRKANNLRRLERRAKRRMARTNDGNVRGATAEHLNRARRFEERRQRQILAGEVDESEGGPELGAESDVEDSDIQEMLDARSERIIRGSGRVQSKATTPRGIEAARAARTIAKEKIRSVQIDREYFNVHGSGRVPSGTDGAEKMRLFRAQHERMQRLKGRAAAAPKLTAAERVNMIEVVHQYAARFELSPMAANPDAAVSSTDADKAVREQERLAVVVAQNKLLMARDDPSMSAKEQEAADAGRQFIIAQREKRVADELRSELYEAHEDVDEPRVAAYITARRKYVLGQRLALQMRLRIADPDATDDELRDLVQVTKRPTKTVEDVASRLEEANTTARIGREARLARMNFVSLSESESSGDDEEEGDEDEEEYELARETRLTQEFDAAAEAEAREAASAAAATSATTTKSATTAKSATKTKSATATKSAAAAAVAMSDTESEVSGQLPSSRSKQTAAPTRGPKRSLETATEEEITGWSSIGVPVRRYNERRSRYLARVRLFRSTNNLGSDDDLDMAVDAVKFVKADEIIPPDVAVRAVLLMASAEANINAELMIMAFAQNPQQMLAVHRRDQQLLTASGGTPIAGTVVRSKLPAATVRRMEAMEGGAQTSSDDLFEAIVAEQKALRLLRQNNYKKFMLMMNYRVAELAGAGFQEDHVDSDVIEIRRVAAARPAESKVAAAPTPVQAALVASQRTANSAARLHQVFKPAETPSKKQRQRSPLSSTLRALTDEYEKLQQRTADAHAAVMRQVKVEMQAKAAAAAEAERVRVAAATQAAADLLAKKALARIQHDKELLMRTAAASAREAQGMREAAATSAVSTSFVRTVEDRAHERKRLRDLERSLEDAKAAEEDMNELASARTKDTAKSDELARLAKELHEVAEAAKSAAASAAAQAVEMARIARQTEVRVAEQAATAQRLALNFAIAAADRVEAEKQATAATALALELAESVELAQAQAAARERSTSAVAAAVASMAAVTESSTALTRAAVTGTAVTGTAATSTAAVPPPTPEEVRRSFVRQRAEQSRKMEEDRRAAVERRHRDTESASSAMMDVAGTEEPVKQVSEKRD